MKPKTLVISAVVAGFIGIGALVGGGNPPANTAVPQPTFYTMPPQPTVTETFVQPLPTNTQEPVATKSAEDTDIHTRVRVRPHIREPKVIRKWKRKFHW